MKAIVAALSLVLGLSPSALGGGYHGGHCDGWWFAPGLAFGLGLGALSAYSWSTREYYPPYSYTYSYPAYGCVASQPPRTPVPADLPQAETAQPQPAPAPEPQPQHWIPSSPGAGTWVPDPEPYSYTPTQPASAKPSKTAPANETVSVTTSLGGVTVYSNTRTPAR